jgi:hypothetical protein
MNMPRSALALAWLVFGAAPAWAGGENADLMDEHSEDEGPPYFGFVRDARGTPLKDAKVSLSFKKGNITYVVQTNVLGMYRMRNPNKEWGAQDLTVSCAKEGYRQTRATRRSTSVAGKAAIETECQMQKE